jgi:hypothetical protein
VNKPDVQLSLLRRLSAGELLDLFGGHYGSTGSLQNGVLTPLAN